MSLKMAGGTQNLLQLPDCGRWGESGSFGVVNEPGRFAPPSSDGRSGTETLGRAAS